MSVRRILYSYYLENSSSAVDCLVRSWGGEERAMMVMYVLGVWCVGVCAVELGGEYMYLPS